MKRREEILKSLGTDVIYKIRNMDNMGIPTWRIAEIFGISEYYVLVALNKG